jgi:hypothetical protein
MARAKMQSEQHLIDQAGESLLRSKLPRHWRLREYRPDYGLDFALEVFKERAADADGPAGAETLGEHIFIQLKTKKKGSPGLLSLYSRPNVEKINERLSDEKVADVETYRVPIETPELVTVERMGIGVPVLLVVADLASEQCSFVCLNDYIDKILVPRHVDYRESGTRTVHVPASNAVGSEKGEVALRWYAKRAKLIAAFQRFTYQYSELQWAAHDDWRSLAELFAQRISLYDFWNDTEMCPLISHNGGALQRFIETGQPQVFFGSGLNERGAPETPDLDDELRRQDVFELWRQLSLLPKTYEDVWREWFLPTAIGHLTSDS